jgi:type II secretory pathway pseudopilin PulG
LIELLVVIAIMAILAALIIPVGGAARKARMRGRAKTELNQIAAMIESYKAKMNFYPPSANNSVATNTPFNPLYYELVGTSSTNAGTATAVFVTLDNNTAIKAQTANSEFSIPGFRNVSTGGEEGVNAQNFTKGTLRQGQWGTFNPNGSGGSASEDYVLLGTSIEGPVMLTDKFGAKLNPIGYNSANPTNNPKSYDLWLDISIGGKIERVYSSFTTL